MTPQYTPPGVYVEETGANSHRIAGAPTSICAFVGRAPRGPVAEEEVVSIHSFADFVQTFGGLDARCPMGYAVRDFFANGGAHALVARVHRGRAGSVSRNGIGLRLRDSDYVETGLGALGREDSFNLLCIPPDVPGGDTSPAVHGEALALCVERRAMLLVDPPAAWDRTTAIPRDPAAIHAALGLSGSGMRNAALYFPRIVQRDAALPARMPPFVPCGVVAGVIARTDAARGVWKAPAGVEASLRNVDDLAVRMTDEENGVLNPLAVNCLRTFPHGMLVWGARTLRGADAFSDEYKFVPVRRLALHIEESVSRGIAWAASEPNGEALWARLRLTVGAFMNDLFRRGALQGGAAHEAYFVKCDAHTTVSADLAQGVCNLLIGFAAMRPSEFVQLKVTQATRRDGG